MKTLYIFYLFILIALAQLYIPAKMIYNQENILKTGVAYKFKTQPVDPSDPFKGKYIYLNYEASSISSNDSTWMPREVVYVAISKDALGFVVVDDVTRLEPEEGAYVKAPVEWYDGSQKVLNFSFPFTEFYMNEIKAYDAEVAHTTAQRDSTANTTYAEVYIKNGEGVLSNVFINDIPIADYIEMEWWSYLSQD